MSKDRKGQFFTSDWHVGHANVLVFDNRPFKDLNHMHEVLVNNYNATVTQDDVCYFLGDMGLGNSDALKNVISRLNGTKVLVLGNHDKGVNSMYNIGFDVVINSASLVVAGKQVTMSHCPLRGIQREDVSQMRGSKPFESWHGESRHDNYSLPDWGQYHLHGHIHSTPNNGKPRSTNRQWDVGVAANNYRPVAIKVIESWVSKNELTCKTCNSYHCVGDCTE